MKEKQKRIEEVDKRKHDSKSNVLNKNKDAGKKRRRIFFCFIALLSNRFSNKICIWCRVFLLSVICLPPWVCFHSFSLHLPFFQFNFLPTAFFFFNPFNVSFLPTTFIFFSLLFFFLFLYEHFIMTIISLHSLLPNLFSPFSLHCFASILFIYFSIYFSRQSSFFIHFHIFFFSLLTNFICVTFHNRLKRAGTE